MLLSLSPDLRSTSTWMRTSPMTCNTWGSRRSPRWFPSNPASSSSNTSQGNRYFYQYQVWSKYQISTFSRSRSLLPNFLKGGSQKNKTNNQSEVLLLCDKGVGCDSLVAKKVVTFKRGCDHTHRTPLFRTGLFWTYRANLLDDCSFLYFCPRKLHSKLINRTSG